MSFPRRSAVLVIAIALASFVSASGARAEGVSPPVVGASEIQAGFDQAAAAADADRQVLTQLIGRADFGRVAAAAGLDIERAIAAVGTLSGDELAQAAAQARLVPVELIGGRDSIVMPVTTIIIVLLVLILLAA